MVSVGDAVQVTVQAIDPVQHRISLSMVEAARRDRDAQESTARRETDSAIGQMNEKRSLGTFADLLAASKERKGR